MNPSEIKRIQANWKTVIEDGDAFVERFYGYLFEIDPNLQSLFKRSMEMQGRKILSMFNSAVEHMGQPEKILPPLIAAGHRHIQYGVKQNDYATVRQAFLKALAETLGDQFDTQTERLWDQAYSNIQDIMSSAHFR